ncbi:hypothetical protein [Methylocystis parvus]|uniref:hypothetical protein n=1 Tax=Methylocystis parvus TaxID=134 RepID=UPI003C71C3E6
MTQEASPSVGSEGDATPALALALCIERLEAIILAETNLLKQGGNLDFEALNARKTHALMEFIQASKGARLRDADGVIDGAERLRELLAVNAEILDRHLQATQEIAMLMITSIRRDDSDGTYSARRHGAR